MCGCLVQRLQETRSCGLKEHEAVFLKRQNLIFSMLAGGFSFVFCFRLHIFTSKVSSLLLLLGRSWGARSWSPEISADPFKPLHEDYMGITGFLRDILDESFSETIKQCHLKEPYTEIKLQWTLSISNSHKGLRNYFELERV